MEPTFEEWERVEEMLKKLSEDKTTYFTLRDRGHGGISPEGCGKLLLDDEEQMEDYREEGDPEGWAGTLEAVRRWVREVSVNNAVGIRATTFRLGAWGPKGMSLPSCQFLVVFDHLGGGEPGGHIQMPTFPVREDIDAGEYAEAVEAVAKGDVTSLYGQLVRDVLGAMSHVNSQVIVSTRATEGVIRSTLKRLESQNKELTGALNLMSSAILEGKAKELNSEMEAVREQRKEMERKAALATGGKFVKDTIETVMMGRALPDNAKELLPLLNDPGILQLLSDPTVQEILKDPANRPGLVFMINGVKNQILAERQAAPPAAPQGGAPAPAPTE